MTLSTLKTLYITASVLLLAHTYALAGEKDVKVTVLTKTTTEWNGSALQPYPSKNPEITILSYEIPAGTKLPMHKHPVINAGVVLQGKLTVIAESGKQITLNAGDSIVELVNQWHYGVNQGDEPVKLIMFYAGEVGVPLVIKKDNASTP